MTNNLMKTFVRELFEKTDYKLLTQRIIREKYLKHANIETLSDKEKSLLKEIVESAFVDKINEESSAIFHENEDEAKTLEDDSTPSLNPKKRKRLSAEEAVSEILADEDRQEDGERVDNCGWPSENESEEEVVHKKKKNSNSSEVEQYESSGNKKKKKLSDSESNSDSQADSEFRQLKDVNRVTKKDGSKKNSVFNKDPKNKHGSNSDTLKNKNKIKKKTVASDSENEFLSRKQKNSESSKSKKENKLIAKDYSDDSEYESLQKIQNALKSNASKRENKSKAEDGSSGSEFEPLQKKSKVISSKRGNRPTTDESSESESEHVKAKKTKSKKVINSKKRNRSTTEDESSESESLKTKKTKSKQVINSKKGKQSMTDDESSDSESEPLKTKKKKLKVIYLKKGNQATAKDLSSESESEPVKNMTKSKVNNDNSGTDSDCSDGADDEKGTKLSKGKKSGIKKQSSPESNRSEVKKNISSSKLKEVRLNSNDKQQYVKKLEKIARACKVLPVGRNYTTTFESCKSANDRIAKLKEILRNAGMEGRPSMERAEEVNMKREAAELSANNIISSSGRGTRNVYSKYSQHKFEPTPSKTPCDLKTQFASLKNIVDSEESDSD